MTTIYAKSQALNVWNSQTGGDNLRVDMVAGEAGSFESRIQHLNAAKEAQPVQFPGPLAFYDDSVRYVLAERFTAVDATAAANAAAALTRGEFNTNRTGAHIQSSFDDRAVIVTSVTTEKGRAISAESALATDLAQEVQDRASAATGLGNRIDNEVTARTSADGVNAAAIIAAEGKVSAEATAARAAELVNADAITAEASTAREAEVANDARITAVRSYLMQRTDILYTHVNTINDVTIPAEATRALAAEADLQSQISNLLANTDGVALNSLAELVADYGLNGTTVTGSLNAAVARITQLESTIAALQLASSD